MNLNIASACCWVDPASSGSWNRGSCRRQRPPRPRASRGQPPPIFRMRVSWSPPVSNILSQDRTSYQRKIFVEVLYLKPGDHGTALTVQRVESPKPFPQPLQWALRRLHIILEVLGHTTWKWENLKDPFSLFYDASCFMDEFPVAAWAGRWPPGHILCLPDFTAWLGAIHFLTTPPPPRSLGELLSTSQWDPYKVILLKEGQCPNVERKSHWKN